MRNDIHSPANLDPAAYEYIDSIYQGPDAWEMTSVDNSTWALIGRSAYHGNFFDKATCDHCGARFNYGAVMQHTNGDVIVVGHTCANERFSLPTKASWDRKRLMEKAKRQREYGAARRAAEAILAEHPDLVTYFDPSAADFVKDAHQIITDMSERLWKYGKLSPKQIDFARKLIHEYENPKPAEPEPEAELREGRYQMTGTILSKRTEDGYYGVVTKMLVKLVDGNRVWGTVPSGLYDNMRRPERGDKISFAARVDRKRGESHFGFFSRPSKASYIS